MSTVQYVKSVPAKANGRYMIITWSALAGSDEGGPLELAQLADRTVQVSGVFDNASVALAGSINGIDYTTLTDPQGNALNFSTAGLEAVSELVAFVKPIVTGGGGLTALDVNLLIKE